MKIILQVNIGYGCLLHSSRQSRYIVWDFMFSRWWHSRLKISRMLNHVNCWIVPDVAKEHTAVIFENVGCLFPSWHGITFVKLETSGYNVVYGDHETVVHICFLLQDYRIVLGTTVLYCFNISVLWLHIIIIWDIHNYCVHLEAA
jgi:hypothetical protein